MATGGSPVGASFEPTLIVDVPDGSSILTDEVYGPVTLVAPYHDRADAIATANATPYRLMAGVFTAGIASAFQSGDHEQARRINARLGPSYSWPQSELWQAPGAVKAMLAELGLPSGPCRLPLGSVPDEARARAKEIIAALPVRA